MQEFLSLKQTVRHTGIKRYVLLEFERGNVIEGVERSARGRRVYSEKQVQTLERVARLRSALGIAFEEAGLIAKEMDGRATTVLIPVERLQRLMCTALEGSELRARVAQELDELVRCRAAQIEDAPAA